MDSTKWSKPKQKIFEAGRKIERERIEKQLNNLRDQILLIVKNTDKLEDEIKELIPKMGGLICPNCRKTVFTPDKYFVKET
jgi:hypothetical protein